ncbi:MAG: hypothetical protein LUD15_05195 [Bacteroides sp.]|nr:hypothetical protein [Bacteroides sp.]
MATGAWDATPLMTAVLTRDECAIGMAQQLLRDNQFFRMVEKKMETQNLRATRALIHIPEEYECIRNHPSVEFAMPMASGSPDLVFSDEENGVIAVKNGEEILYASLYWRARYAVNNLAKIHYITPVTDRIANIYIETEIADSDMHYTRPDWVNLGFVGWREWYEGIHSAHAGEELAIVRIPEGVPFTPGEESSYTGRARYYKMEYGNYLVAMNSTADETFMLEIPAGKWINLSAGKEEVKGQCMEVPPVSTLVLYKKYETKRIKTRAGSLIEIIFYLIWHPEKPEEISLFRFYSPFAID